MSTFCLKVMVVSIVLYDHIDPNGAFYTNPPINLIFFFFFFFFFCRHVDGSCQANWNY
jgi:hypothetical protein